MNLQHAIYNCWQKVAGEKAGLLSLEDIDIGYPKIEAFGDYTTSLPFKAARILKQNPETIANKLIGLLKNQGFAKIEYKAPGFINFWLTKDFLVNQLNKVQEKIEFQPVDTKTITKSLKKLSSEIKLDQNKKQLKFLFEFAHPNTHKELHIGHLKNITLAESLIRLQTAIGVKTVRANYQGDVGMHIAKALWALLQNQKSKIKNQKLDTIIKKVKFLGEMYAKGSKAYEENEEAKKEIIEINRKIYDRDPEIYKLWQETRQWSLDYFELMYKRVGSRYDRYYFESEVYESGKKIVLENIGKIFEKSEGAIIFSGKKYGLHNRVFITGDNFPTYEAKDMGLGVLQFKEYDPDLIIHVVGPEQAGYFKVIFKALEKVLPASIGREMHYSYGWVQLKKGKMSSRLGNVVTAKWLLDEAKKYALKILEKSADKYTQAEIYDIAEKVAIASVKYSMLKIGPKNDILFDFAESVNLEGDSGAYLLYTYARCQSVLRKELPVTSEYGQLNQEETALLRSICRFREVVSEAALNLTPNILCTYLFDLAQKYNFFYAKHSILTPREGEKAKTLRLLLTKAVANILKTGLDLLGIQTVEKM